MAARSPVKALNWTKSCSEKRPAPFETASVRPSKRARNLLGSEYDEESSPSNTEGGVAVLQDGIQKNSDTLNINKEFARRFEHNKKREELQRCRWPQVEAFFAFADHL